MTHASLPYRYRRDTLDSTTVIEVELGCINGLSAWFVLGRIYDSEIVEINMTDGAIGCGVHTAKFLVDAANIHARLVDALASCQSYMHSQDSLNDELWDEVQAIMESINDE